MRWEGLREMGTALAGPQPTPPTHSTFPASDLELVVDRLTFPLCAVLVFSAC